MSSWSRVRLDELSARVDYGLTASATADKLGPIKVQIKPPPVKPPKEPKKYAPESAALVDDRRECL